MTNAVTALLLGDVARAAFRLAGAFAVTVLVALAFAIASVLTLLYGVVPAALVAISSPPAATSARPASVSSDGADASVVAVARAFVGTPYVWGGADPRTGFDCSGLVQWAFRRTGVDLPRTAHQQYLATRRVAPDELRPGDLVYFQICCQPPDTVTHVGIYVGGGQMVHAPAEGQVVRVESIDTPFWRGHFAGAGRPVPPPGGGR